MEVWDDPDDEDPDLYGPEADLYNRDAAAEEKFRAITLQHVERLLKSLSPADSTRRLVDWVELKRWGFAVDWRWHHHHG